MKPEEAPRLLPLKHPHKTSSHIDSLSRKTLALVMVLVLAVVSLFVAGREAQAKEQPVEQAPQQQYSKVVITNGEVAESNNAKIPQNEVPPKEDFSPPPVVEEEAPPTPEPALVPNSVATKPPRPEPAPAPQQFAMVIVNGEVIESDPGTSWPVPEPADGVTPEPWPNPVSWPNPIPGDAWLPSEPPPSEHYSLQTSLDPEPVPPSSEDAWFALGPPAPTAPWPGTVTETPLLPVSSDPAPKTFDQENGPASFPANQEQEAPRMFEEAPSTTVMLAPPLLDKDLIPVASVKNAPAYIAPVAPVAPLPSHIRKPSAMPPAVPPARSSAPSSAPVSMHRAVPQAVQQAVQQAALRPPSSLGATVNAVSRVTDTVRSTAASAAASAAEYVSETLADHSSGKTTQEEEGTPQQPAPPLVPSVGGSFFSLMSGGGSGGQIGSAGGVAPLLAAILASSLVLLRPDRWKYLVSCDLPKPSSALLLPLERPG